MNNKWMIVGISLVALAALVVAGMVWAGTAYAQSQTPPVPGYYRGMMGGGYGMMGEGGYGAMHAYMIQAYTEVLDLPAEEIQSRINAGETPWQIARSLGLTDEEIQQIMQEAHDLALQQAEAAGVLTQAQADWMAQHMETMWQGESYGFGGCHAGNGDGNAANGSRLGPMMRWSNQPAN